MAEAQIKVNTKKTLWFYIAAFCMNNDVIVKFLGRKTIMSIKTEGGRWSKIKFDFGLLQFGSQR